jgi:predicted nucleic acid-binding protein
MIVVSDTSALTSLIQIGRAGLLPQINSEVFIPEAVRDELLKGHSTLPGFLACQKVKREDDVRRLLVELDLGEAEAIVLAKELNADDLLIDETEGRRIAKREGVHVIGLPGVLLIAKKRGLISPVRQVTEDLERRANFRVAESVKEIIFREAEEP